MSVPFPNLIHNARSLLMRAAEPHAYLLLGEWSLEGVDGVMPVVVKLDGEPMRPLWMGSRHLVVACIKAGLFRCAHAARRVSAYRITPEGRYALELHRDVVGELRARIRELEEMNALLEDVAPALEEVTYTQRPGVNTGENRLLDVLSSRPGKVFPHALIAQMIGSKAQCDDGSKTIQVMVSKLRKKGYQIKTAHGRGYYVEGAM